MKKINDLFFKLAELTLVIMLSAMVIMVFGNVVLRYGFGSGVAASEELSRLLFVWMVFIGATAAYPLGEHMAFTSLLRPLQGKAGGLPLMLVTRFIHLMVVAACLMVGWGAWEQVVVGLDGLGAEARCAAGLPLLSGRFVGGVRYWDGQFEDA
eukprot:gene45900-61351_t